MRATLQSTSCTVASPSVISSGRSFERGLDKLLLLGRHTPEELFT